MNMKGNVKKTLLMLLVLAISFEVLDCNEKPTNSNGNDENEIRWQQTVLDSLRILTLASDSNGDVFASSCGNEIYRTTDHGTTWISVHPGACPSSLAINANGEIFAVGGSGYLHSSDNGESWVTTFVLAFSVDLKSIAFNSQEQIFVGSQRTDESQGGVYFSRDNGQTWIESDLPDSIDAQVLTTNNDGDIFAGTSFGIFRSTDNGQVWVQINNGFARLGAGPFVSAIAINPANANIFAAVEFDGVYRSVDNGDTWVHTSLTDPSIRSIVINSKGHIFAGSGTFSSSLQPEGVFYSKNNGGSWVQIHSGLTNTNVRSLTVDSSGYVFAGTHGNGIFRTVKSTTE